MANELIRKGSDSNDMGNEDNSGYLTGYAAVGNEIWSLGFGVVKGALRYQNVVTSGSVDFARLVLPYNNVGSAGSGSWKFKTWGIDEDNTSNFSGNPFGRTHTTANVVIDEGRPTSGGTKEIDVKAIMNEIIARGGWSSGNSMGFLLEDNGTSFEVGATFVLSTSYLVYRQSAEPNFKPTPKTVSAPSLPSTDDFGIKMSKPGQSVLDAAEADLYFTTRRKQFKVHMEAQASITTSTKTISHGLGYIPFAMVFIKYSGTSVWEKYPSFGITGYYVNATNLYIDGLTSGDTIYYYIFGDELVT